MVELPTQVGVDPVQFSQLTGEEILARLDSRYDGLTSEEVRKRLLEHGQNVLETSQAINPLLLFFEQFKSFIIYILLFAVAFSLIIGEYVDSILILVILLANALIGFFQELNAHRSLEALKKITALHAIVLRAGKRAIIDAAELVPGDILVLEAGDKVPADARLLDSVRFKVEESALTGESVPAEKNNQVIQDRVQIADQQNMLFASTSVVAGNGRAVVVGTGMDTEIGRITTLITSAGEEMTPLQRRLQRFGKKTGTGYPGHLFCCVLPAEPAVLFQREFQCQRLCFFSFHCHQPGCGSSPHRLACRGHHCPQYRGPTSVEKEGAGTQALFCGDSGQL